MSGARCRFAYWFVLLSSLPSVAGAEVVCFPENSTPDQIADAVMGPNREKLQADRAAWRESQGKQEGPQSQNKGSSSQPTAETTVEDCEDERDEAQKACQTQDMTAGMTPIQAAQAAQYAAVANASNQQVQQLGLAQAIQCQNQANLSAAMVGLSQLKGQACVSSSGSCKKTCDDAYAYHRAQAQRGGAQAADHQRKATRADKLGEKCREMDGNGKQAFAQAAAMLANMYKNIECANALASVIAQPQPPAGSPAGPPTPSPGTIGINPSGEAPPGAIGVSPGGGTLPPGSIGINPSGGRPPVAIGVHPSPGPQDEGSLIDGRPANGPRETVGSGGTRIGTGAPPTPSGVLPGRGGTELIAGGAPGNGRIEITPGGGSPESKLALRSASYARNPTSKFELKSYRKPASVVGGVSSRANDGVTGALGPSLWEKVSHQYTQQLPNLIPEE